MPQLGTSVVPAPVKKRSKSSKFRNRVYRDIAIFVINMTPAQVRGSENIGTVQIQHGETRQTPCSYKDRILPPTRSVFPNLDKRKK